MSEESFAEIVKREGVSPPAASSQKTVADDFAAVAGFAAGAAVLPPDEGDDAPFAAKKTCAAGGADRKILAKLHRQIPENVLDLHGLTAKEAHAALDEFLRAQIGARRRHVEIIHGKGGRDHAPVLPGKTRKWLSGCRAVLGWTEVPRNSGAVRVLLRKQ